LLAGLISPGLISLESISVRSTAVDYVPELLKDGRRRAAAEAWTSSSSPATGARIGDQVTHVRESRSRCVMVPAVAIARDPPYLHSPLW